MPRTQVLLEGVPALVDDLLRQALAASDVELLPRGSTAAELRYVDEDSPPPIVIIMSDDDQATQFERDLLLPHPATIVIRVESAGHQLAARSVTVDRTVTSGSFSAEDLIHAIEHAPTWRQRFA